MKILVTGAAGFIGYFLSRELAKDPENYIICVDDFSRGEYDVALRCLAEMNNVSFECLDLTDPDEIADLPNDVSFVYHLAAFNGTQNFYDRPFDVLKSSTLPAIHLLEKYAFNGELSRFIYAGSSEAYAGTVTQFGWAIPTDESVPLCVDDVTNPRWSYATAKLHGEVSTIATCNATGVDWLVVRYHNVYGPRMGMHHVIPDFFNRAKKGEYSVFGWEHTRSFMYVKDAVEATRLLAHAKVARNQVVNIGSENEVRILDLAYDMMNVIGVQDEISCFPGPKGSVSRRTPDIQKLRSLTGFRERWKLHEGLAKAADYYYYDKPDAMVDD